MNAKITFDSKYTWSGGFGCWFKSKERGVSLGDVRLIRGRLFYAYNVYGREVHWTAVEDCEYGELVKFRNSL